jgi:hypothetical protein
MKEELLHHIWKYGLFDQRSLKTDSGEPVSILKPGEHNRDRGPDFVNARIKIGDTTWAGNIEIHITSDDWYRHFHQRDSFYDNTLLHVVYEHNASVKRTDGSIIPVIELKELVDRELEIRYEELMAEKAWVPCQAHLATVDELSVHAWLDRVLVERLEEKCEAHRSVLEKNAYNWEETFYQLLARNFGFKVNSGPFEMLAMSLPLGILEKHRHKLAEVEALLFGQAGLLNGKFKDNYPQQLQREYKYLSASYNLKPIEGKIWKFLRLRPANFPTVRIAQFAQLICRSQKLFSGVIEQAASLTAMKTFFSLSVSGYWNAHYVFGKKHAPISKNMGASAVDNIIINTIVPLLFLYGRENGLQSYCDRAADLLSRIPPENNSVINNWKTVGVRAISADVSQALLKLKTSYCDKKQCLSCGIGNAILNRQVAEPSYQG